MHICGTLFSLCMPGFGVTCPLQQGELSPHQCGIILYQLSVFFYPSLISIPSYIFQVFVACISYILSIGIISLLHKNTKQKNRAKT